MTAPLPSLLDLGGKVALVTGAGAGIGQAIATRLHEARADVAAADLDGAHADRTASALDALRPGSALGLAADVSDPEQVREMVAATTDRFGRIDILVNNAGIFPFAPLADLTQEMFDRILGVNLRGVFLCTKAVAEVMIRQGDGGAIVNVTSVDAVHPSLVGLAAYDASKHGVWGFTKNTALELAAHGIRVNALAPGGVLTPGVRAMMAPGADPGELAHCPMGRLGDPDEIARVALVLASDLAAYMTGAQVVVDGGMLLL